MEVNTHGKEEELIIIEDARRVNEKGKRVTR